MRVNLPQEPRRFQRDGDSSLSFDKSCLPVLASVGAELSSSFDAISRIVYEVQAANNISAAHMLVFSAAAESVAKITSCAQHVARQEAANDRKAHEFVRLDDLLIKALSRLAKGGRTLQWHISSAEVDLDLPMLSYLVDAVLEWSACQGQSLRVSLDTETEPGHAFLEVRSDRRGDDGNIVCRSCEAEWNLIAAASRTLGVQAETWTDAQAGSVLSLRFICASLEHGSPWAERRATVTGSLFRCMNRKTSVPGGSNTPATDRAQAIASKPFGMRAVPEMPALPEVSEGNSQADWTLWEQSMSSYDLESAQVKQVMAAQHNESYSGRADAFAFNSVTKNSA